jgi:sugar/nucleoside kinase (ribokinase family)
MGLDLAACGRLASACAAAIIAQYGARAERPLLPLLDEIASSESPDGH